MASQSAKLLGVHVVAFPFPAAGHIAPFVQFSKILAGYGITVTFVTTTSHLSSAKRALIDDTGFAFSHNVQLVALELPIRLAMLNTSSFQDLRKASASPAMKASFEELIRSLMDSPRATLVGPPVCIISDMFLGWTQVTATKYRIPRYCLLSSPAHFLSLCYHLRYFVAQGRIPVTSDEQAPFVLPGFPPVKPHDVSPSLQTKSSVGSLLDIAESLREAMGVLVNSINEMESSVIEGLRDVLRSGSKTTQVPSILMVGPTLLDGNKENMFDNSPSQASSHKNDCIDWLTTQPTSSVLYIAFGSIATLSATQIHELALGLETSGPNFLWVLRAPQGIEGDISAFLPQGFMERTKKQGLVYSAWAPQLQILAHPAVGGFLTHCGWNSTVESICMAVPMIAWPIRAEQHMNKTLIVDVLNVAVGVQRSDDGLVSKEEVERAVRLLMEEERGEMLRRNVKDLSATVRNAVGPGGSSKKTRDSFVKMLQLLQSQSSSSSVMCGD